MTDRQTFKSAILAEVEGALYFRQERAKRYPDDERNAQSAESLSRLASSLEGVGEDDVQLDRCYRAYWAKHVAAGNVRDDNSWLDDFQLWFPKSDDDGGTSKPIFTRYGFDAPNDGDATAFLVALYKEIERWDAEDLCFDASVA